MLNKNLFLFFLICFFVDVALIFPTIAEKEGNSEINTAAISMQTPVFRRKLNSYHQGILNAEEINEEKKNVTDTKNANETKNILQILNDDNSKVKSLDEISSKSASSLSNLSYLNSVAENAENESTPYTTFSFADLNGYLNSVKNTFQHGISSIHTFFDKFDKRVEEAGGHLLMDIEVGF